MKFLRILLLFMTWSLLLSTSVTAQFGARQTIGACGASNDCAHLRAQWIVGQAAIVKNAVNIPQQKATITQGFLKSELQHLPSTFDANVFPNPFSKDIHIDLNPWEAARYSFQIYDTKGKEIIPSMSILSSKFTYTLEHLFPGTYFITINDIQGKNKTYTIIKL